MSLFQNDCGCNNSVAGAQSNRRSVAGVQSNRRDECEGCVCDQLRNLTTGTEIEAIFVNGRDILDDVDDTIFVCFDRKTCCATFVAEKDNGGGYGGGGGGGYGGGGNDRIFFTIDCRKIDTIFIEKRN
ncbi:hypothetical protein ACFW35_11255 [Fictibacillus sp. NPDC058756]|uniref:hypothetical protein n=1 Tax=Fictibacillus sp. NPDC058756 TaxID=3346625 RepID=UPI0036896C30